MPTSDLSRWTPWEFRRNFPEFISTHKFGLYAYYCFDPFVDRILLNKVPRELIHGGGLQKVHASEVSTDWLEDKLFTRDLFSQESSYLVLQSESLGQSARNWLLENEVNQETYFILSFGSDSKFFQEIVKKKSGHFYRIDEPPFWEMQNFLQFFCDEVGVGLNYECMSWMVDSIPNKAGEFINALKLIKLNFPEPHKLKPADLQRVLTPNRFDQFKLASLFGQKNLGEFYRQLLNREIDFEELQRFFGFMQGHAYKLLDTSYIQLKKRPSKYDKEIQAHSKKWQSDELQREMRHFGELQLAAKGKKNGLKDDLRLAYLSNY